MAEDAAARLGGGQLPQHSAGVGSGWAAVGPPHKQRYLAYQGGPTGEPGASSSCGALLQRLKDELFQAPAFARLLHK